MRATGRCDTVFKGFSNCLLQLGDNMASYPQELEEKENLQTICTYVTLMVFTSTPSFINNHFSIFLCFHVPMGLKKLLIYKNVKQNLDSGKIDFRRNPTPQNRILNVLRKPLPSFKNATRKKWGGGRQTRTTCARWHEGLQFNSTAPSQQSRGAV